MDKNLLYLAIGGWILFLIIATWQGWLGKDVNMPIIMFGGTGVALFLYFRETGRGITWKRALQISQEPMEHFGFIRSSGSMPSKRFMFRRADNKHLSAKGKLWQICAKMPDSTEGNIFIDSWNGDVVGIEINSIGTKSPMQSEDPQRFESLAPRRKEKKSTKIVEKEEEKK